MSDIEQFARTKHGRELYVHIEHLDNDVHDGRIGEMPPVQEKLVLAIYDHWKQREEKKKERKARRHR